MILSVDGGATKTCSILFDEESGKILSIGLAGPSNFISISEAIAAENIKSTISQIEEKTGKAIPEEAHIIVAQAGIGDSSAGTENWKKRLREIFKRDNLRIENDGLMAYRMANMFQDGVIFAPGTGSVGMMQKDGKMARLGGWGWFAGDDGSASWIGKEALSTAEKQMDRIYEGMNFVELVSDHFGDNFKDAVGSLEKDRNKRKVALLCPKVVEMAKNGDEYALKIIYAAADYDASAIKTMLREFDSCPEVSVLGGTMKAGSIIRERISSQVKCPVNFFNGYHVAVGGIIMGLQECGIAINKGQRDRMIQEVDRIVENFNSKLRLNSLGY